MSTTDPEPVPGTRLADRLAAAWRRRFVGREAETELFRAALAADEPPFAVLHVFGPGGVGKTTLLGEYARLAAESGRLVARVDGHTVEPAPPAFGAAMCQALGLPEGAPLTWPGQGVLLIDTYERLAPLDSWLRQAWLPELPARWLVVIAGRHPPAAAWRTDLDWAGLTRIISLRNLPPEASRAYLAGLGLPPTSHAEVVGATHGHPLALALVAELLAQGEPAGHLPGMKPEAEPDVVRVLLERFVQEVPSPQHGAALEVCAVARTTTEPLLAAALDPAETPALFAWLRGLSFVEAGPFGLFPHDLAREVLVADLRWRNPERHAWIRQRLNAHAGRAMRQATGLEQQRLQLDYLYLGRHDPAIGPFFAWDAMEGLYAEPAAGTDADPILAMVRAHEGAASADIAAYWLQRQPRAFQVFRTTGGAVAGFLARLSLAEATPADRAADPAVAAALALAEQHAPAGAGEAVSYLRFWMERQAYQPVGPVINLTAMHMVTHWLVEPRLSWSFIAMSAPDFWLPHFSSMRTYFLQRLPAADFEVDGRRWGVFGRDFRAEPLDPDAHVATGAPASERGGPLAARPAAPAPQLLVLSQVEFGQAVRQALRDYARPSQLAANPLLRSRLAIGSGDAAPPGAPAEPAAVQEQLRAAAASLSTHPKDQKLYRALWHTYFDPAPSQEAAAERLGLPFSTYRYQLAQGIERIIAWLWQRETAPP